MEPFDARRRVGVTAFIEGAVVSTDSDKKRNDVVEMPDIYGEEPQSEAAAIVIVSEPPLNDDDYDGESRGFDPYDTARLYKK
jgi:hypothetical protein